VHHAASTRARPRREESGLRRKSVGDHGAAPVVCDLIVDVSRRARARGVASSDPGLATAARARRPRPARSVRRVSCILARL
jgi:hypothetical protein